MLNCSLKRHWNKKIIITSAENQNKKFFSYYQEFFNRMVILANDITPKTKLVKNTKEELNKHIIELSSLKLAFQNIYFKFRYNPKFLIKDFPRILINRGINTENFSSTITELATASHFPFDATIEYIPLNSEEKDLKVLWTMQKNPDFKIYHQLLFLNGKTLNEIQQRSMFCDVKNFNFQAKNTIVHLLLKSNNNNELICETFRDHYTLETFFKFKYNNLKILMKKISMFDIEDQARIYNYKKYLEICEKNFTLNSYYTMESYFYYIIQYNFYEKYNIMLPNTFLCFQYKDQIHQPKMEDPVSSKKINFEKFHKKPLTKVNDQLIENLHTQENMVHKKILEEESDLILNVGQQYIIKDKDKKKTPKLSEEKEKALMQKYNQWSALFDAALQDIKNIT